MASAYQTPAASHELCSTGQRRQWRVQRDQQGRRGSCSLATQSCGVQLPCRANTVKGLEYLLHVERLREPGLLILEKKMGRGISSMCTDDLNSQSEGARRLVLVPSDRRVGSGQTSEHRECSLSIRQDWFVIMRVVKPWHRLPRGL